MAFYIIMTVVHSLLTSHMIHCNFLLSSLLIFTISISVLAQEPPKKANTIIINEEIAVEKLEDALKSQGFTFSRRGPKITAVKAMNSDSIYNRKLILRILHNPKQIMIKGYVRVEKAYEWEGGGDIIYISRDKLFKTDLEEGFRLAEELALKLSNKITYHRVKRKKYLKWFPYPKTFDLSNFGYVH